jgi:hypothetical protein
MRARTVVLAVASGLVGLGLALGIVSTTTGQGARRAVDARELPLAGRYQLAIAGPGAGIYMTDTVTGDCWNQVNQGEWISIGNPRVKPDDAK